MANIKTDIQEGKIELMERTEVPVVNKEARVAEEILLSKDVAEWDETIRNAVRATEVDIERPDGTRREIDTDVL